MDKLDINMPPAFTAAHRTIGLRIYALYPGWYTRPALNPMTMTVDGTDFHIALNAPTSPKHASS